MAGIDLKIAKAKARLDAVPVGYRGMCWRLANGLVVEARESREKREPVRVALGLMRQARMAVEDACV